jgi:tetratricopeptide (TPR) repeat protein
MKLNIRLKLHMDDLGKKLGDLVDRWKPTSQTIFVLTIVSLIVWLTGKVPDNFAVWVIIAIFLTALLAVMVQLWPTTAPKTSVSRVKPTPPQALWRWVGWLLVLTTLTLTGGAAFRIWSDWPRLPPPAPSKSAPRRNSQCAPNVEAFDTELENYKKSLGIPITNAYFLDNLAGISYCVGRDRQAELEYETAVNLLRDIPTPEYDKLAKLYMDYGILFRDTGRPERALEKFTAGLDRVKDHRNFNEVGDLSYNRGSLLSDLGKCAEALPDFKGALQSYEEVALKDENRIKEVQGRLQKLPCK